MPAPADTAPWPQSVGIAFFVGLAFVAAVPGAGYFYGQFVETIVLCIGGIALAYAGLVAIASMNRRIAELERRLGDRAG